MERLKELRKSRKITQTELANILNVEQTTVSKWENNRTIPDIDMLKKISNYFNVSISELIGEKQSNLIISQNPNIPEIKQRLINLVLSLSEDEISDAEQLLRGYLFARNKDVNKTFKIFDD